MAAPTYTHAFDFYYKAVPTASLAIVDSNWYIRTYYDELESNIEFTRAWYNLWPNHGTTTWPSILTRLKPTTSASVQYNGALAWGSAASDFLWNVLTPSMSVSQSIGSADRHLNTYRFTYNSESLLFNEYNRSGLQTTGVAAYPITSSWIAYEPRMIANASGSTSAGYVTNGGTVNWFPASLQVASTVAYSLPTSASHPTTTFPQVGQNPPNVTYGPNSTGSNDGRFFDLAGGCGITRTSISASLVAFTKSASFTTTAARNFCTAELKKRRLFFPTIRTGSMAFAVGSPGIWVQSFMGKPSNEFFTENGGIYNVKFTLKRDVSRGYYPDTTGGSELLVYLHNINTIVPAPSGRVAGADGWYPPEANIVRIKNDPAMTFLNPSTGYLIETFNINLVQYGTPAQLVFEVTGSLANNAYFGCIIDDVEFCKVGVTTDPNLIKPTTIGGQTAPYEGGEELM